MTDEYPYAAPWRDRHDRVRWRFRRGKKVVYLPGKPGDPEFEASYRSAFQGQPVPKPALIVALPTATFPRSIKAAWRIYTSRFPEWMSMRPLTRLRQSAIADEFLTTPVAEGESAVWGDMPIAELKRRHLRTILADMADRPHAGRCRLNVIRKMIYAALEEEWIEIDPSYKLKYRPATKAGFRAWEDHELASFETRWPYGTTPRLVYELALWLGSRRGDLALLAPSDIRCNAISWKTGKTGREVTIPITSSLSQALAQTDLTQQTIVTTAYGKPFSAKSLTGRMRDWTEAAGLSGCTLHGLRKTLGKRIAEAGGSTRMAMAALGHDDLQQAELYSEAADRERLAAEAMSKVVALVEAKKRRSSHG